MIELKIRRIAPNCFTHALGRVGLYDGNYFVEAPPLEALEMELDRVDELNDAEIVVLTEPDGEGRRIYHMMVCNRDDPTHGSHRFCHGAEISEWIDIPEYIKYFSLLHEGTEVVYFRKKITK